jgi:electron transfer flavoprotein alpha subunit
MKILVITEQRQGKWNNTSFETLAAAQQIAADTSSTVSALVIGKGLASNTNCWKRTHPMDTAWRCRR